MPKLDDFAEEVLSVFYACDTQWEWSSGMSFSRRVGIPNDRVMREARVRGYFPEETFMDKFHAIERVLIEYDIEQIPKDEADEQ